MLTKLLEIYNELLRGYEVYIHDNLESKNTKIFTNEIDDRKFFEEFAPILFPKWYEKQEKEGILEYIKFDLFKTLDEFVDKKVFIRVNNYQTWCKMLEHFSINKHLDVVSKQVVEHLTNTLNNPLLNIDYNELNESL